MIYEYVPPEDNREDKALALSSAVGNKIDQPFCRVHCAAICTVDITPVLLASETTLFFKLVTSELPVPSPNCSRFSFWDIATCS